MQNANIKNGKIIRKILLLHKKHRKYVGMLNVKIIRESREDKNENKRKTNGINNGGHVNLPDGLYFGI